MKIGYFGTPAHSAYLLEQLIAHNFEISFVVTNMDKFSGRNKNIPTPSPVKNIALKYNLSILQFPSIKTQEAIDSILSYPSDLNIVFAYGAIIPETIFARPRFHTINLHGSLLPEYRGASPVQSAILDGKSESGFSIQYITKELDAGDIVSQKVVPIEDSDNSGSLLDKITKEGTTEIIHLLKNHPNSKYEAIPQEHSKASFCKKIKSEDRKIDFGQSAESIYYKIKAFNPGYIPYGMFREKRIYFLQASLGGNISENLSSKIGNLTLESRKVLSLECGNRRLLYPLVIQLENKNPMNIVDFINGYKPKDGEIIS